VVIDLVKGEAEVAELAKDCLKRWITPPIPHSIILSGHPGLPAIFRVGRERAMPSLPFKNQTPGRVG